MRAARHEKIDAIRVLIEGGAHKNAGDRVGDGAMRHALLIVLI